MKSYKRELLIFLFIDIIGVTALIYAFVSYFSGCSRWVEYVQQNLGISLWNSELLCSLPLCFFIFIFVVLIRQIFSFLQDYLRKSLKESSISVEKNPIDPSEVISIENTYRLIDEVEKRRAPIRRTPIAELPKVLSIVFFVRPEFDSYLRDSWGNTYYSIEEYIFDRMTLEQRYAFEDKVKQNSSLRRTVYFVSEHVRTEILEYETTNKCSIIRP